MLSAACCMLSAACCMLSAAWCMLSAADCMLFAACCKLQTPAHRRKDGDHHSEGIRAEQLQRWLTEAAHKHCECNSADPRSPMARAWMKRSSWGVRAYLLYSLQSTTTCAAAPLRLEERVARCVGRYNIPATLRGSTRRERLGSITDAWHRRMYASAAGVSSGRRSLHAQEVCAPD
jgi:hypothetical protein